MIARQALSFMLRNYYSNYHGLPSAVWQGILISFIEATLVGICAFLPLYIVHELQLDVVRTGILMAFHGLGTILGGFAGGKLSDRFPPRMVSIAGLLIQALAYFILIKNTSQILLACNLFLIGLGSYVFITSNHAWTLACCKGNQRLKTLNILDVSSNLGLAVSGMIIGFVSIGHFHYVFGISSTLLIMTALSLVLIGEQTCNPEIKKETLIENHPTISSLNIKILYFALISLFFAGCMITQIPSTYSIYLTTIFPGMGNKSISILFTLNAILIVLFQAPVSNFFGRYNKIIIAGLGSFLLELGLFLLNFACTYAIAIGSCLLMTMGEMLFFSNTQLICYENAPSSRKGRNLGFYRTVYATSRVIGPATGSIIYQGYSPQTLWVICFLTGALSLITSIYFFRTSNQ